MCARLLHITCTVQTLELCQSMYARPGQAATGRRAHVAIDGIAAWLPGAGQCS